MVYIVIITVRYLHIYITTRKLNKAKFYFHVIHIIYTYIKFKICMNIFVNKALVVHLYLVHNCVLYSLNHPT